MASKNCIIFRCKPLADSITTDLLKPIMLQLLPFYGFINKLKAHLKLEIKEDVVRA